MLINYQFKYPSKGKWIFVATEQSERKGRRLIKYFSKRVDFPDYFFHYKSGGHIAALHSHIQNKLFFKIDIQNFYNSIARLRVTRALRSWAYPGANTLATWSCVSNPIAPKPRHVLPIGFVQSPLLASLVLMKSPVTDAIERAIGKGICVSVYMDDFIGSHSNQDILGAAYLDIQATCVAAGFVPNPGKLVPPNRAITAFNCDLTHGSTQVNHERIARYEASLARTPESDAAFAQYRALVASANK
jgi:hypothetical protein